MSARVPRLRSRPARWPWAVLGGFFALAITGSILVAVNEGSMAEQVPFIIAFAMFGIVGALITSRAHNRIGALLLWCSGVTAASFVGGETATYLIRNGTTEAPLVVSMALTSTLGWLFGIMPAILFIPQIFPTGLVLSRRWLLLAWATWLGLGLLAIWAIFGTRTVTGSTAFEIPNPLYVEAIGALQLSDSAFLVVILGALIGGIVSLIVRFRRSSGVERQQIKWVAAAIGFLAATMVLSTISEALGGTIFLVDTILSGLAFLSIPVAIGVGVLQYRLFELDVVITKALIAGTLALLVVGAYAGLVWLFGAVASGRESSASLFVIALLLGIAFRPVTRLARKVADRVVYGRRATPYEVLTEFSERVGSAYATEDVLGRMARILGEGVGAEAARVWLRVGSELRPSGSWPAEAPPAEVLAVTADDRLPAIPGETAVEVRDGGELLGALSVLVPANDPMTPAKERLVHDLASQAGLVLRNVRLVEELRASQRRIVTAQDQERRRIERNIHDGAQQQLVALTVKMRLAQSLASKDAAKTEEILAQMQEQTQTALEDLRDLARGIYPPLLADQGLPAALEAQLRKTASPAELEPDGVGRYAPEVEAAVYFSVLEALQNVAKYAGARRTEVRLGEDNGWLTFVVEDDGRGFDPGARDPGTGLQGIADRVSALDGELEVRSAPGEGTTLSGRIPVGTRGAPAP